MERFTTDDLVLKVRDGGLTESEAERIVALVINSMKAAIVAKEEVHIKGLGKFVPTYRPQGLKKVFGKPREVTERHGVKFRPYQSLLESMNEA